MYPQKDRQTSPRPLGSAQPDKAGRAALDIALGNDYNNPGAESGMPLKEMQWLIEAGLSPNEVDRGL